MRKLLLPLALLTSGLYLSQVGINTETPTTTLEIIGKPTNATSADGVKLPYVSIAQLIAKDNQYQSQHQGTLLYVTEENFTTANLTTKTVKVTSPGLYYFDGSIWQRFLNSKSSDTWFYMPSFNLDMSSLGTKTVNLYNIYKNQVYKDPQSKFISSDTADTSIHPQRLYYNANELSFIVTDYDPTYITIVGIDNTGVMTYTVNNINPPAKSFINIILKPKN